MNKKNAISRKNRVHLEFLSSFRIGGIKIQVDFVTC